MGTTREFTALIEREEDGYVSLCPELDIASQGDTVEEAHKNLAEAVLLFLRDCRSQQLPGVRTQRFL